MCNLDNIFNKTTLLLFAFTTIFSNEETISSTKDSTEFTETNLTKDHSFSEQTISSENQDPKAVSFQEGAFQLRLGPNYTYMKLTPQGFSSFHGNLWGANASIQNRPQNQIYEALTLLWRQGSLKSSNSLTRTIYELDSQVRLGYTLGIGNHLTTTFFSGFGWKYFHQKLRGGASALDLNYNEVYIPVGLLNQYLGKRFSIGLNGIWMPQIFPTVNFVPLDNARWITEYTLANFQVELPMGYRFYRKKWNGLIELKPFFQFWQDGKTLAQSSIGSPLGLVKNTYYIAGTELNFGAEF